MPFHQIPNRDAFFCNECEFAIDGLAEALDHDLLRNHELECKKDRYRAHL